jgi:putative salt-induced outer membrane protein YdiY
MKRAGLILTWVLFPLLAGWCQAQGLVPAAITNQPSPLVTNTPPEATTNIVPVVTPPKPSPINGSTLMSAFGALPGGKFSLTGRTLKLPVPAPSTNAVAPDAWRRSVYYGMSLTQGNSDILRYSLGLDALKERKTDLFRVKARGVYGESDNKTDTENAIAAMRYERQLTDITYGLGHIEWMTDSIAGLDYRVSAILSPGVHLIRTDETLLNLEAGAGYLTEKKGNNEQGFVAGRFAITFEKVINSHALFWLTCEYLPKLLDSNVFYINSEVGLATVVARNLSLTVSLQDRYDNAPAEDTKSNDSVLTTALNLNF